MKYPGKALAGRQCSTGPDATTYRFRVEKRIFRITWGAFVCDSRQLAMYDQELLRYADL
jgi:hypothetical protein